MCDMMFHRQYIKKTILYDVDGGLRAAQYGLSYPMKTQKRNVDDDTNVKTSNIYTHTHTHTHTQNVI